MLSYTRTLRGALRTTKSLWDAGTVKIWFGSMPFGFITPESGGKLFVHRQHIGTPEPPLVRRLQMRAAVTYDVEQRKDKPEGKMQAVNVRGEAITDKTREEWSEERKKHREEMRAALEDKTHPLHERACALQEMKARRMAKKLRIKQAKEAGSKLLVGKKEARKGKKARRKAARAAAYEKMTPEEKAKVDAKREERKAIWEEKRKQQKESDKKIAA